MKVVCLGGAGRICREAAFDLVANTDLPCITIADSNADAVNEVVAWLDNSRVRGEVLDVFDESAAIECLSRHDIVVDGTTIGLNGHTTRLIGMAGCHGLNLNGFGEEYAHRELFEQNKKIFVPGFGMTPGTTDMMAKHACDQLDEIETIRVSHGAYRPFAFSRAITETTTYEYDPALPGRVVYENGHFIQVPPFARPREIRLPEPYGSAMQYIIPHAETVSLAEYLKDKKVGLIEVRGTWPQQNMRLVRALYEYGFMRNEPVTLNGETFGIMEAIGAYLQQCPEGRSTELYGYALHVEVVGLRATGERIRHTLWHTHPASDGSVPAWAGLRAYTRNVGIPLAVGAQLIATGRYTGTGVLIPEKVFAPADVFSELKRRDIVVHEELVVIDKEELA